MRAVVVDRFGPSDVVRVAEVPRPQPRAGEVLVRVEAAAVTAGDARLRAARFPAGFGVVARPATGFRRPRVGILGGCLSGTVEAVGAGVTSFAPRDEVAGFTGGRMRAHAEYAIADAGSLARMPAGVTHADAAGILFGGSAALFFLRDRAKLAAGETALINGASGSVGSAAVQFARAVGARVTGVASARNQDFVRRIGAAHAIDYAAASVGELGERFDVVLDAVGTIPGRTGLRLLSAQGRLVLVSAGLSDTVWAGIAGRGRVFAGVAPERGTDVAVLLELVAAGKLDAVTHVAGGLDAAADAHRLVDSGRKVGNIVVLPHGNPA